ncbi:tRNA dihydrouridine synthase [Halopseudomonas salegens]|uniref:tRNA-dihydrouridine(16) synthase n=1 Tax=Halopseudomonas salegens TaxID=1434072 RepID=A0A1H2EPW8_9GAMM|nr:tRNA-dihydrouridine synthase family protein [Halopseudomonas salegens]SDT97145.1 tRNA-U20a,U20b-dihydrouridine synthase [Halopseudomonas salegens]
MSGLVVLAPMEGLVDPPMRDVLTRIGGIDWCVSEFIRVTAGPLQSSTLQRLVPEAEHGWTTATGVPVHPQLLGSDLRWLAHNAHWLAEQGAPAVDLNFGCPAKTVNRHRGGAVLLQEPEMLAAIVSAVRAAVPAEVPVTAKMRLGYSDTSQTLECAQALADSGAAHIVVHARTKAEGYKPVVHWDWLARIRDTVAVPVIANGEVWNLDDYHGIRAASGCEHVMLGRGLVGRPDLARQVAQWQAGGQRAPLSWAEMQPWLLEFYRQVRLRVADRHAPGRLKQWLGMLTRGYPEAQPLFDQVRRETCADTVGRALQA